MLNELGDIYQKNGKGHTVYYCFPCRLHYYCVSVFVYVYIIFQ